MNSPLLPFLLWLKQNSGTAAALSLKHRGGLKDDGWFRSVMANAPVDAAGNPLPWISYAARHFLEKRVRNDMTVFEFGSGYSTLWWAGRARKVVACESNEGWCTEIQRRAPANTEILLAKEEEYPSVILKQPGTFDVIVIDGGDRVACVPAALDRLSERGVIIWDDTERTVYQPGFDLLRQRGFSRIEFAGMGPVTNVAKETSVFYRTGNIFSI
jgi:precorrin-6B methylase 2